MEPTQIIFLVIVSITLIGGMAIAITAVKIAVPRSYDEKMAAMENQTKERIALIEKGIDPAVMYKKEKKASNDPLFWGLLLLGIGSGSFFGNIVWHQFSWTTEKVIVDSLACLGGGLGLVVYHISNSLINRKKAQ